MKRTAPDQRTQPLRRQTNEAFCGPDGRVAISKVIAVFAQITVLYHMGSSFNLLVTNWDSLLVVLTFLIAPDTLKKVISMKYGGNQVKP